MASRYSTFTDYSFTQVLGQGTFGKVYKCLHRPTNENVAIKVTHEGEHEASRSAMLCKESYTLEKLQHANIVRLLSLVHADDGKPRLVLELMDMNLRKYIYSLPPGQPISRPLVKRYMFQILEALNFCHQNCFVHFDLKPDNLLIDQTGILKVADFGLARQFCPESHSKQEYLSKVVSLMYRAPEALVNDIYYPAPVDVWSIGIIFAEMLNRGALFGGANEKDQLGRIFKMLGTPSQKKCPRLFKTPEYHEVKNPAWTTNTLRENITNLNYRGFLLLKSMLIYNPRNRATCAKMVSHRYFLRCPEDHTARPVDFNTLMDKMMSH